jgi:hypothetical protein
MEAERKDMYLQRLEVVLWSCGADPDEISRLDIGQWAGTTVSYFVFDFSISSIGFPLYDLTFSVLPRTD